MQKTLVLVDVYVLFCTLCIHRSLHVALDLNDGKPIPSQTIVIRFKEAEATVSGVVNKAMEALGNDEPIILTDSQGNQILESSGTTGSVYWKQNSRKIFVVKEAVFNQQREQRDRAKRRRSSPRDDELACLQEISEKTEDVLLTAQGLGGVAASLRCLTQLGNATKCLMVSAQQTEELKTFLNCLVCKGPMDNPVFTSCCSSLIGCWACVEHWCQTSSTCLKCRAESFTLYRVNGLAEVFAIFRDIIV
ncbi:hypothetical protein ACEWY4_028074 [Coilia grayii]|uniref:RING-type domain-containing protein n=1 Tax=Coilia grayii TaxID=363190 RepID=A0ABD1IMT9_9TELE